MNDEQLNINIKGFYAEALALEQAGYFEEAKVKYQEILGANPDYVDGWYGLSRVYYYLDQNQDALAALERSLELDGSQGCYYYQLGLIWEKLGNITEAILAYQQEIELDSQGIEGCLKLGDIWAESGEWEAAEFYYYQAIERQPKATIGYLKLGNLFLGQNQVKKAIAIYETGLTVNPHDSDLFYQMALALTVNQNSQQADLYFGLAAESQHRYETAIQFYQKVLQAQGATVEIYLKLGNCYQGLDHWEEAVNIYEQGLQQFPDEVELYLALILAWQNLGETQTALQIAAQAVERFPNQISVKWVEQSLLPILYDQFEEIATYREHFTQKLTQLIQETDLENLEVRHQALKAIGRGTYFYLQYQGYDDLKLQQQYGKWVHQVMNANYPEWTKPLALRPLKENQKIKIGYISPHLTWHTVGLVFLGWLRNCEHNQFEIYCYFTGEKADSITNLFELYSDYFYHIYGNIEKIVEQILADELDILVFLDIGMCPQMTQIAGLRLAPTQCVAWGHPVTTGLPTIDYFISAEFLEPLNAETHYSETLIRLPNLGINYHQPLLPEIVRSRSDFGLKPDSILYLSCQSLFKYLPDFDQILVAISQQVKSVQFVFIAHWNTAITEKFKQRLKRTFAQNHLNSEDYYIILPRLDKENYLQLNLLADIGLDSIQFTGFLTTLDSLSCGLPLVTCEGKWMRSRQSAGILKRLGITEIIAQNQEEYIKIAVKLGLNPEWRLMIREKIQQNKHQLYEDTSGVKALEKFYQQTQI